MLFYDYINQGVSKFAVPSFNAVSFLFLQTKPSTVEVLENIDKVISLALWCFNCFRYYANIILVSIVLETGFDVGISR